IGTQPGLLKTLFQPLRFGWLVKRRDRHHKFLACKATVSDQTSNLSRLQGRDAPPGGVRRHHNWSELVGRPGEPSLPCARWWEPFVEHQINEHARRRNIKPDWHRHAADTPMLIPAASKRRNKRHDHQW